MEMTKQVGLAGKTSVFYLEGKQFKRLNQDAFCPGVFCGVSRTVQADVRSA